MSKLWGWLLGLIVLVAIGFLVACGTSYNSASNGLVLVTSEYSSLVQTFSFSLGSGNVVDVYNPPYATAYDTCVLNGIPSSIVVDPAGGFAYMLLTGNTNDCGAGSTATGILAYRINSSGSLTQVGSLISQAQLSAQPCVNGSPGTTENVAVLPNTLVMDTSGRFLYVANNSTADASGLAIPGSISVFSIGSGGSLTEVTGSPFTVPVNCSRPPVNITALATTPTVAPPTLFGEGQAVCSAPSPFPTSEYLYAADSNYLGGLWEFAVNGSTGALVPPPGFTAPQYFPVASTPMGVTVDSCDRFVYVSNNTSNNVSAFTICTGPASSLRPNCIADNGFLNAVTGSPFTLTSGAQGPGPLRVDVYGNFLYVLDTITNQISPFRISPVTGGLIPLNPATVQTGIGASNMVIRQDDDWMFVTDFVAATVSEYSISPATGALAPQAAITTDNYPWGVAVK